MSRTESIIGTVVLVVLGVLLVMAMAHWGACEQYEGFCSWKWPSCGTLSLGVTDE